MRVYIPDEIKIGSIERLYTITKKVISRKKFKRFKNTSILMGNWSVLEKRKDDAYLIYTLDDLAFGGISLFRFSSFISSKDTITFSSKADMEIFRRIFVYRNVNVELLPFAVDDVFKPTVDEEFLEKYEIPSSVSILLYVGRIVLEKNVHTLLRIFKEVLKRYDKCILLIVGKPTDSHFGIISGKEYKKYLGYLAEKLEIDDKVRMIGFVEDEELVRIYSSSDIFVTASILPGENFGFAVLEAQACGTPVIASKWGGFKDTILHRKTGFHFDTVLTKRGIVVDKKQAIQMILLLLRNEKLRNKLKRNCVLHVKKNYSLHAYEGRIMRCLRRRGGKLKTKLYYKKEVEKKFINSLYLKNGEVFLNDTKFFLENFYTFSRSYCSKIATRKKKWKSLPLGDLHLKL